MDIFKLFELLNENPININILYSNINGKESLKVNGEEIYKLEDRFKNEYLIEQIKIFKENLDILPDGLFNKVLQEIEENIDLQKFNELLEQTEFTNEEIDYVKSHIKYINNTVKDIVQSKIDKLSEILNKFSE